MEEQQVSSNKKTIVVLIGLVVLVAAVALTVYLVQQKQIFKPKAYETPPVSGPETSLTLAAPDNNFPVGNKIRVSVLVRSDIDAANLFVSKIKFPINLLQAISIETEPLSCIQVVTRACSPTQPVVCQDFPTPCDVPSGWTVPETTVSSKLQQAKQNSITSNYFIKNWTEKYFDNQRGIISLVGEVPSPGWQSRVGEPSGLMADIIFVAKASGSATIAFDAGSAIYRNSDNRNILSIKRDLSLTLGNPVVTVIPPTPTTGPLTPRPTLRPVNGDINQDGKIDLTDLSILLSRWGRTGAEADRADLNQDGVVNTIDRSLLINILIKEGIIRQT